LFAYSRTEKFYTMEIKVLGPGCYRCRELEKATKQAIEELGIDADFTKEEDISKIMTYGISRTPGLVVDGEVVLSGKLASVKEIKELLAGGKNK